MKEKDLAWAAGFIDGEGCIRIIERNTKRAPFSKTYHFEISASQTVLKPLEKLQKLFGGTIRTHVFPGRGKNKARVPCYLWSSSTANEAIKTIELLLPYFEVKEEEGRIMLKYFKYFDKNRITKKLTEEIHLGRQEAHRLLKNFKDVKYNRLKIKEEI